MEHRLAPQTCCELTPYMHPICQNRGPFALSIMIEPAAISMTDDLRTSILILTRRERGLMDVESNS
jgi:hypothetical protein